MYRRDGRAMPNDLVFIRHGESEANVVQRAELAGEMHEKHEEIAFRADWQQRLTEKGVEQAKATGKWIEENLGGIESFNGKYVSPFLRTRETAGYIGGNDWIIDDRIIERFLGVYGVISYRDAEKQAELMNIRDSSPWYARLEGAESMQDVFSRYRAFQDSIRRHQPGERVIVVSHGNFIKAARYAIEWMLPEKWLESETEVFKTVQNGAIVHYTRVNPENSFDVRESITWLRIIYPSDLENSPNNGQWKELKIKRRFNASELLESANFVEPLL